MLPWLTMFNAGAAIVFSQNAAASEPLVFETSEWVRIPDDGDAAVYDVTVSRDAGQWTLKVTVDATGLLKIDRGGRRQFETRRDGAAINRRTDQ